jgi:hypothetical protein
MLSACGRLCTVVGALPTSTGTVGAICAGVAVRCRRGGHRRREYALEPSNLGQFSAAAPQTAANDCAPAQIAHIAPVEVGRIPTAVHRHLNAENKTPLPAWKISIISPGGNVAAVFAESDSTGIFFYLQHIEHYGADYSSRKFSRPLWFHLQVEREQR